MPHARSVKTRPTLNVQCPTRGSSNKWKPEARSLSRGVESGNLKLCTGAHVHSCTVFSLRTLRALREMALRRFGARAGCLTLARFTRLRRKDRQEDRRFGFNPLFWFPFASFAALREVALQRFGASARMSHARSGKSDVQCPTSKVQRKELWCTGAQIFSILNSQSSISPSPK